MFCYIFRLSFKQPYSKIRCEGNNCAIVSRSGYIWIWSGARDQESTNHSAHFTAWMSSYITKVYVNSADSFVFFLLILTSLLYILLIYWQFFVILILTLVYQSLLSTFFCCQPLFSWFKRFICTILFPVQMLQRQPLFLRFLALVNPSSFLILRSSNQSFFFFFWWLVK